MPQLPSVTLKPDFARTADRFEAWWRGEALDRPPVSLYAASGRRPDLPAKTHASLRDRYLDVEYNVETAIAHLEAAVFPGDTLPLYYPNVGPELCATLVGCELEFGEHTSWSAPIIESIDGWREVIGRPLDFDNPYWQAIEAMTDLAIERCQGRFLVGIADLHDNYDTMAALRDPQGLCMDLMEDRNLIEAVGRDLVRVFREAFSRLYHKVSAAGMGSTTWSPLYHQGPAYLPSCDFWCMVGPEIARELVLPDIVAEMQVLDRSLFHLDGPQALRHLDLLLELPQLDAVQWVFGAGNGPAARWIEVYRRILAAGKSVQVLADTPEDGLAVLDALGPRGLWLTINSGFAGEADALAYLREVERHTARAARG